MTPTEWFRRRITARRIAYRDALLGSDGKLTPQAEIILKDLARFCRAHQSTAMRSPTGAIDPLASARADGRREVWLRIIEHLALDDRFLVNLREGADKNE